MLGSVTDDLDHGFVQDFLCDLCDPSADFAVKFFIAEVAKKPAEDAEERSHCVLNDRFRTLGGLRSSGPVQ